MFQQMAQSLLRDMSKLPVNFYGTEGLVINGVKLRYPCRNKLPRIILVSMHGDDYVINASSISPGVRR